MSHSQPMLIPRCFSYFLRTLGPYQSLLVLAVPLAVVEPLKMLAVFIIGEGRFITGVIVMICAYAGSLLVTERLFSIVVAPNDRTRSGGSASCDELAG